MSRNGKFKFLLCVSLIVLVAASGAFAQSRISRANQAVAGQKVVFTVVGSSSPVCLDVAQLDDAGNLLTFSSYYIGALQTKLVAPAPLAGNKSTSIFAISELVGTNPGTACQTIPAAFINDPAREPKIFEQLTGGNTGNIGVNQANAALVVASALCVQSQSQTAINNNDQTNVGNASGRLSAVVNTGANVNTPVVTQVQGQACAAINYLNLAQVNVASVNQVAILGFEELSFQPAGGSIFTTLLANCNSPWISSYGASVVVNCKVPLTGVFSDQSFH